jgi:hypothetical protein
MAPPGPGRAARGVRRAPGRRRGAAGAVLLRHTVRSSRRAPGPGGAGRRPVGRTVVAADGPGRRCAPAGPAGQRPRPPRRRGSAATHRSAPTSPASSGSPSGARTGRSTPGPSRSATAGPTSATAPCCAGAGRLTRARLLGRLDELLPGVSADARSWRATTCRVLGATRQPDGRVLLVGDALSLVNPMTGEGYLLRGALRCPCAGAAAVRAAVGAARALQPGRPAGPARRTGSSCGGGWAGTCGTRPRPPALARRPWVVDAALRGAAAPPDAFRTPWWSSASVRAVLTPRALLATAPACPPA